MSHIYVLITSAASAELDEGLNPLDLHWVAVSIAAARMALAVARRPPTAVSRRGILDLGLAAHTPRMRSETSADDIAGQC
eukprot:6208201-Pleurochrysis_carterae.AAC.4